MRSVQQRLRAAAVWPIAAVLLAGGADARAAGDPTSPLPVRRASVSVTDRRAALRVQIGAAFDPATVDADGPRSLCLSLWTAGRAAPRATLCLDHEAARPVLRLQRSPGVVWPVAVVARGGGVTFVRADVPSSALGVGGRWLFWQVQSRWSDPASCPDGCVGSFPPIGKETVDLHPPGPLDALGQPRQHGDARDATGAPLDVVRAGFGQVGTDLALNVVTRGTWSPSDLRAGGRSLCLTLTSSTGGRRVCIAGSGRAPALTVVALDGDGAAVGPARRVDAEVWRDGARDVQAQIAPRALGLSPGPFAWSIDTRWQSSRGPCAAGCADRVPDSGVLDGRASVFAGPRCFGAAARDPARPCRNPLLDTVVFPAPADALLVPDAPCRELGHPHGTRVLDPCAFGELDGRQHATVALLGDSHARTWRSALEVVAQRRGWKGVSITRAGCPFSTEVLPSPDLGPGACAQLHAETLRWLGEHPSIHTVFVSAYSGLPFSPAGYVQLWRRLPSSVRRVVVLRDNPVALPGTPGCVRAARAARRRAGRACGMPRGRVLLADPQIAAARAMGRRARVVDLTPAFCGPQVCLPVVGGAYVYKDDNHMGATFAATLGPLLLRRL